MDLVSALYREWYACVGTIAEGAPIIPISAQLKYNVDAVCEYIVKKIPVPIRDFTSEPRLIGEFAAYLCNFCIDSIKFCLTGFFSTGWAGFPKENFGGYLMEVCTGQVPLLLYSHHWRNSLQ